jgi:hypothetical protein
MIDVTGLEPGTPVTAKVTVGLCKCNEDKSAEHSMTSEAAM